MLLGSFGTGCRVCCCECVGGIRLCVKVREVRRCGCVIGKWWGFVGFWGELGCEARKCEGNSAEPPAKRGYLGGIGRIGGYWGVLRENTKEMQQNTRLHGNIGGYWVHWGVLESGRAHD